MKEYKIVKKTHWYSFSKLQTSVEKHINELALKGWETVNISFLHGSNGSPLALITISRDSSTGEYV